jgi:hypothetical protein
LRCEQGKQEEAGRHQAPDTDLDLGEEIDAEEGWNER